MFKQLGFRIDDLKNAVVGREAKVSICNEFGKDVRFARSDFHGKSEKDKIAKDKEQQKSGQQI